MLQAIKEGRWRKAENPRAYIRKVVSTLERKAIEGENETLSRNGLKPIQFREGTDPEVGLEWFLHHFDASELGNSETAPPNFITS